MALFYTKTTVMDNGHIYTNKISNIGAKIDIELKLTFIDVKS